MKYFDSHAHYNHRKFSKDRNEILLEMRSKDVEYIVDSISIENLRHGLQMAKKHDHVYLCINDHGHIDGEYYGKPHFDLDLHGAIIEQNVAEAMERVKNLCKQHKKIVAYGECYMDFRRSDKTPKTIREQSYFLLKDLEVARAAGLPVCIHSGNADDESFAVIKSIDMPDYGGGRGMMHSYLGPPKMALEYIDMGYLISVTGVVTHRSARGKNLAEVVKTIPLSGMIIETDAPYLTPEPFRDKRNDSSLLRYVVEAIAELKRVRPEEVAEITLANAKALYRV